MRYPAFVDRTADGRWSARHDSTDWGRLEVFAATPEQAVDKLRQEIRYRLELCPCSGEMYRDVQVEIVSGGRS